MNCTVSESFSSAYYDSDINQDFTQDYLIRKKRYFFFIVITNDPKYLRLQRVPLFLLMFCNRYVVRAVEDSRDALDCKELLGKRRD